ncbi:hypothetical protein D3C85_1105680 [compost metagenome]
MSQPGVLLAIDVLQLTMGVTQSQVFAKRIVTTEQVHMIAALAGIADVVIVRGVAVLGFGQSRRGEGQVVDVLRRQVGASESLGQQSGIGVVCQRMGRHQGSHFELGLGQAHFCGRAKCAVFVHWL